MHPGSTNEQLTLQPLEEKLLSDFHLSKFIVCTDDGEKATNTVFALNEDIINKEEQYDGFYGTCTNLDDDATARVKINQRRWKIEECFRMMESKCNSRPVYLSREDPSKAHFMTCFVSLIIYRFLEKSLVKNIRVRK